MNAATNLDRVVRDQLLDRSAKLRQAAVLDPTASPEIARLLHAVDEALAALSAGTYGLCRTCHDPIETERLLADPLTEFCLDHLTAAEQRALEADLELAARVQRGLLPSADLRFRQWEIAYHYEPAGVVSGDYCDVVPTDQGALYFMVGDVSGKGVAASLLMSQLHAMMRTLISLDLPLAHILERAGRVFCESTMASQYATLVCGRAEPDGRVELCNAGHPPPFVIDATGVTELHASGLPLGLFRDGHVGTINFSLNPGQALLIYSDGVSEAESPSGEEFGRSRLSALCRGVATGSPRRLIERSLSELVAFRAGVPRKDDVTIFAMACGSGQDEPGRTA